MIYRMVAEHLVKKTPTGKCKRCGAKVEGSGAVPKVAAMFTAMPIGFTFDQIASPILCDECRKPREYPKRPLCGS